MKRKDICSVCYGTQIHLLEQFRFFWPKLNSNIFGQIYISTLWKNIDHISSLGVGKKKSLVSYIQIGNSSFWIDLSSFTFSSIVNFIFIYSADTHKFVDATGKLAPVGYGIKKLQIMLTIVDDLVSVDTLIEEHLLEEPINEYVQSCDIVAFNKICKYQYLVFIFHNLLQVIKSSIYCSASFFPHEIPEELYYHWLCELMHCLCLLVAEFVDPLAKWVLERLPGILSWIMIIAKWYLF